MIEEGYSKPRGSPQGKGNPGQGQERIVGLRVGSTPKKCQNYSAPHTSHEARQPPSLQPRTAVTGTSPLGPIRVVRRGFPIRSLGSRLLRSRTCSRLAEPEPARRRPGNAVRTARGTAAARTPRGAAGTMLRAVWRALGSLRTPAVTQAPGLGVPGGECARLPPTQWGLSSPPGGEEPRNPTAGAEDTGTGGGEGRETEDEVGDRGAAGCGRGGWRFGAEARRPWRKEDNARAAERNRGRTVRGQGASALSA